LRPRSHAGLNGIWLRRTGASQYVSGCVGTELVEQLTDAQIATPILLVQWRGGADLELRALVRPADQEPRVVSGVNLIRSDQIRLSSPVRRRLIACLP
jgi:hypothetical protein